MAESYDVQTYLLDRANIRDTVVRAMHLFDTGATAETIQSVYTSEIHLDYDQRLGFTPEVISSESWAQRLDQIHKPYDETQHIIQNLLVTLPQPTGKHPVTRPDRCEAIAYAHGWFYNLDTDNRPRLMARRQGGKHWLELLRLKDLEENGENPWRIHKQEVRLSWQDMGTH
ncbi:uncharacterized protein BDW43DRAFT_271215 [Aspergillus alliaceus]|uniref:uncharacterized protein n=1 Tax=Petromyces alliaceus TaxID=209559 RepID=UPI0012A65248|nr:uncharacterized protein BDW43DRAFT_271215 [Aspergillus alliaceus]KAB8235184.1 hypothetical protein BDW43DRAFT_271215 [Aspergillus alliaceus]